MSRDVTITATVAARVRGKTSTCTISEQVLQGGARIVAHAAEAHAHAVAAQHLARPTHAFAAMVAVVADVPRLPGLTIPMTDREALLVAPTSLVEFDTLESAVAR